MKKAFVLFFAMLSVLSMAQDQGISVNSPYLATEWCTGKNLDINWNKWGNWTQLDKEPGSQFVRILLIKTKSRGLPQVIAEKEPNDGSFDWTIPLGTPEGEYRVRVLTVNKQFSGQSNVFKIKSCQRMVEKMAPVELNREARIQGSAFALSGSIAGKVSGSTDSHLLAGRKVRVLLKKAGTLVRSAEYTLDSQGSADYQFNTLAQGDYVVTLEKVASTGVPAETLNICFNGANPAQHAVTIDAAHLHHSGKDFSIQFSIAWDMHGVCW